MPAVISTVLAPAHERAVRSERTRDDDLTSTICLKRVDPGDCGERQVFARVDDGPRIALRFGETVTIEVPPGLHVLSAHNTLFRKKLAFAIEPAEHLEFELINSARWWTAGVVGLLGSAPLFLTVRQVGPGAASA